MGFFKVLRMKTKKLDRRAHEHLYSTATHHICWCWLAGTIITVAIK
jgi:hypothetical protein